MIENKKKWLKNLAVIKKRLFLQRHYEGSEVRWRMDELRGQNAP